MFKFKLYDKVYIKSKNVVGFIVDILNDEKCIVEKEGNEGPLYFDIDETDMELVK